MLAPTLAALSLVTPLNASPRLANAVHHALLPKMMADEPAPATPPAADAAPADAAEADAAPAPPPPPPPVEYAKSLPFLVKRKTLDGYVGADAGFDPFGFSEVLNMDWLREAELKHCRVAMLATVGFVFTDFYHLPGFDYSTLEAHDAAVASGSMSQLLLWLGLLEIFSAIKISQTMGGEGSPAGDYGFDPIGFGADPAKMEKLQMKELANGRTAMLAFGGMVTQAVLTGNTFPYLY